ncbi:MAG: 3-hydroxybutyryl-CoA dehydratase [bacterium]|jgi:3-hydroxybutyryl-CoA dehydratase
METALKTDYEDVKVGQIYSFTHTISEVHVKAFAELSGDFNPLHVDKDFGAQSKFGKNVVHGMLTSSLFSRLMGMYCPGEKCLYLSQTMQFKMPLFYEETVEVRGTILKKVDAFKIVKILTEIYRGNDLLITGEANAQFIS